MNVVIANEQQNQLAGLDVDIIKSLTGVYDVSEIVEMFGSFFYSKMILDVTALKRNDDLNTYEVLARGLDPDKIVFLLPEGSVLCTPNFLAHLISIGIYNFTSNLNGVKYLLRKSNTLQDVEKIRKMANVEVSQSTGANVATFSPTPVQSNVPSQNNFSGTQENGRFLNFNQGGGNSLPAVNNSFHATVIGVKNITNQAGATTFIYLLRKELVAMLGQENVFAIEIGKNDFQYLNDRNMISVKDLEFENTLRSLTNASIVLVDLNDMKDTTLCSEVLYLVEPSTIKLNKLIRKNRDIFRQLMNKKVVLNKSLLSNNDVFDFEGEAGIKVFYNMPPLDERKRNAIINDFLTRLGLFNSNPNNSFASNKIFGLFRR